ncbi:MAG: hypothetical protein NVSMB9_04780 [Isosphaeraceae bacterium]
MTHQERVDRKLSAAEEVLLSIRRNPLAVRLEWPDGPHKGREVLYAADAHHGLMHVNMADSILPVPRLSMAPDSPLALRNSRHPITEAGFDTIVAHMEEAFQRQKSSDTTLGPIRYDGLQQPEELDRPCHKIVRAPDSGETWTVYIDPSTFLPALVQAISPDGELLEQYIFRSPTLNRPELARADAFDPDSRWGPPRGFFKRLARSNPAPPSETDTR